MTHRIIILCAWMLLFAPALQAGEGDKLDQLIHKISGNEPSYFVEAKDKNDATWHTEFYLSVKFPLMDQWLDENLRLFFAYNGKYDFYLNSRHSSPIISRLQNPGLLIDYTLDDHAWARTAYGLDSVKLGYFHESNGQTVDTLGQYLVTANAGDYVSRGWDYLPLELNFASKEHEMYLYAKGRYFLSRQMFTSPREDTIFWEPWRLTQPHITDYDGIRILLRKEFAVHNNPYIRRVKLAGQWRSGYTRFNLSQRYEVTADLLGIPMHAFWFRGYGKEIAFYHQKDSYFGIGFEMW